MKIIISELQLKKIKNLLIEEGESVSIINNGKKLSGKCDKGNCKNGRGNATFSDGSKYSGNWVGGNRTYGKFFDKSDGTTYTGTWVGGLKNGSFTVVDIYSDQFFGKYVNDKRNGKWNVKENNGITKIITYKNGQKTYWVSSEGDKFSYNPKTDNGYLVLDFSDGEKRWNSYKSKNMSDGTTDYAIDKIKKSSGGFEYYSGFLGKEDILTGPGKVCKSLDEPTMKLSGCVDVKFENGKPIYNTNASNVSNGSGVNKCSRYTNCSKKTTNDKYVKCDSCEKIGTLQGCLKTKNPSLVVDNYWGTNTELELNKLGYNGVSGITDADITNICGGSAPAETAPTETAPTVDPITMSESDLIRMIKRVVKESEGKYGSDTINYLNDNFTPDGGWDNDKFQDGWMNGELTAYYVNGKLAFIYNTEFDDDGGEREFNTLVVGPEVYEKIKEMFGKGEWKERFTNWFKGNTRLNVDDVEMDDFKGIFSDYVDPSWADDENWDY